ncbi:MAG: BrnT family toxin [Elusimicrobia bacterium]|nr:BrnT family toxin [Elusimicrobiota bacterium]
MKHFEYIFEWDSVKAGINARKHQITFERAATVFKDPRVLSQFDVDHSQDEERWITLGIDHTGTPLVACHTFLEQGPTKFRIRIFSSRKATKNEIKQYRRC